MVRTVARLAWLLSFPWNPPPKFIRQDSELSATIARHGCLPALQWARDKGYGWGVETCTEAAGGGHIAMLQWARQSGCPISREECGAAAAGGGHLETLQLLAEEAAGEHQLSQSNESVRLYSLRVYLRRIGAGEHAAAGGHINVLQWLLAHTSHVSHREYVFIKDACCSAAEHGQLAALQWLRAHGCRWSKRSCLAAASSGEVHAWVSAQLAVEVEGDDDESDDDESDEGESESSDEGEDGDDDDEDWDEEDEEDDDDGAACARCTAARTTVPLASRTLGVALGLIPRTARPLV